MTLIYDSAIFEYQLNEKTMYTLLKKKGTSHEDLYLDGHCEHFGLSHIEELFDKYADLISELEEQGYEIIIKKQ